MGVRRREGEEEEGSEKAAKYRGGTGYTELYQTS
jgi:hypothetical protein